MHTLRKPFRGILVTSANANGNSLSNGSAFLRPSEWAWDNRSVTQTGPRKRAFLFPGPLMGVLRWRAISTIR